MNTSKILFLLFLLPFLLGSCEKDDNHSEDDELATRMNQFIRSNLSTFYLWHDEIPDIKPESEKDPKEYFKALLSSKDKWSLITDDVDEFLDEMEGTGETYGYGLAYGQFSNSKECFAVVQYVYPGSPAAEKLKRGDIIVKLNSQNLTEDDLNKLTKPGTLRLGLGKREGNAIGSTGQTVTITSRKMDTDPILITKLFELGNHKIGYLMYTLFSKTFNSSIAKAFNEFKEAGITDLVLDLRYNHGGDDEASTFLCSAIVPKEKAIEGTLLSKETWNTPCQKIFESDPQYDGLLNRFFVETNCNLDLPSKKIYILTTRETISASEYTIACLKAFMDVELVGTQTYGKYVTMYSFSPQYEENGKMVADEELANWLIFPVCSRFSNINGYPSSLEGMIPQHEVNEDLFNGIQLGDANEPLLAEALALISGTQRRQAKGRSIETAPAFNMLPKSFNDIKSNRIIHVK